MHGNIILSMLMIFFICLFCFFFKQIIRQILEAHASMLNLSAMDARLTYIRNWQGLADFGISYYIVRFNKQRKDVSVKITLLYSKLWMICCRKFLVCHTIVSF